jgi:hypothetical protein
VIEDSASSHDKVVEDVVKVLARYGFEVHREHRVYYWDMVEEVTSYRGTLLQYIYGEGKVVRRPRRRYIKLDAVGICSSTRACSGMVVVAEVEMEYMDYGLVDRLQIAVESMRPKPTHMFIVTWRALTYSEIIDTAIRNHVLRLGSTKLYIVNSVQQLEEILRQLLLSR